MIVDFRKMAFFTSSGGHYEESKLNQVLGFDTDRIIYSPTEIDRIIDRYPNEVVGVIFYQAPVNQTKDIPFQFVWANDVLPAVADENTSCYLKNKLKLVGKYKKIFNQYRRVVSSCIGIHARFGNGELEKASNQPDLDRMKTPWTSFFSTMDIYPGDQFFVCTDTPSFLEKCLHRYGDRVIHLNRFMPPENCGPGHNIWSICNDEKKAEYIEARNRIGSYRLLGEALIEMFLLGECVRLVCNQSSFTHYARMCCQVESIVFG
ncbi:MULTISPECIES: hypothetical protein [unclassified Microcoleus]|uniref:hypothetical protein n=1 Tax=unclassified Microcoleus TaxID=2642155 RepID=UPI002FCFDA5B